MKKPAQGRGFYHLDSSLTGGASSSRALRRCSPNAQHLAGRAQTLQDALEPAAPLTRVFQLMVNLKSRSFPVIGADHQLVGMISREDVIRALKEATQND
jgi:Mg/Co/Ni transporter MgtE